MRFTSYNVFMRDLYRGGIEYSARHSAELGFSGVEFLDFCDPSRALNKEKLSARYAKEVVAANGLTVDCFSAYANLLVEETVPRLHSLVDYAADLGSPAFHHTLLPWVRVTEDMPEYDEVFDKVVSIEREIAKHCAERNMKCLYEPQGLYFNGVEGISRLIRALEKTCDSVGLCADLGNSVLVDEDPVSVIGSLAHLAGHAHLKNYLITDEPLGLRGELLSRGGKYLNEVMPPEGAIDLKEGIRLLRESGYRGSFSLEFAAEDEKMLSAMEYLKGIDTID